MKINQLGFVWLLAVALLLASAPSGFSQGAQNSSTNLQYRFKNGRAMLTAAQRFDQFKTELKLTDDQKPKVKAILEDTSKKIQDMLKDPNRPKSIWGTVMATEFDKLKAILTSEQLETYKNLPVDRPGGPVKQK
jgi:hypothetical protein